MEQTASETQDKELTPLAPSYIHKCRRPAHAPPFKRHELTLGEKVKLIQQCEGKSQRQLARMFNIGKSQVGTILRRKQTILDSFEKKFDKDRKRLRYGCRGNDQINELTFQWFSQKCSQNAYVSGPMLQEYALSIAKQLNKPDFKASNGWLESFRRRHKILKKPFTEEPSTTAVTCDNNAPQPATCNDSEIPNTSATSQQQPPHQGSHDNQEPNSGNGDDDSQKNTMQPPQRTNDSDTNKNSNSTPAVQPVTNQRDDTTSRVHSPLVVHTDSNSDTTPAVQPVTKRGDATRRVHSPLVVHTDSNSFNGSLELTCETYSSSAEYIPTSSTQCRNFTDRTQVTQTERDSTQSKSASRKTHRNINPAETNWTVIKSEPMDTLEPNPCQDSSDGNNMWVASPALPNVQGRGSVNANNGGSDQLKINSYREAIQWVNQLKLFTRERNLHLLSCNFAVIEEQLHHHAATTSQR